MSIDISKLKRTSGNTSQKKESKSISEILSQDISLFGNNLGDDKKEAFYMELEILLSAGVDIKTALELIVRELPKEKDKQLFEKIKDDVVKKGIPLSEAMKDSGKFSAYEYFSIQIGEETGKIHTILKELSSYYHSMIRQKRQVVSALTYPAIMITTSVGVLVFMLAFVVPMLSDMYKRVGQDLPFLTQVIIDISDFVLKYFYVGFLLIAGLVIFIFKNRKKEWYREYSTKMILRIPLFKKLIQKIYLARFCNSMALLLGSKIPIVRALSLVKQMIDFYPIEVAIPVIENDILKGTPLNKSMANFKIFYPRMVSLIKVGEEVNRLEFFFSNISKQYTEEVEHDTSMLSKMIEPLLLLFIGVVVGVILVAMYLPLIKLGTTIQ
jgi:type IV pilus assembly protein PilC